jgi:hypothetical protein
MKVAAGQRKSGVFLPKKRQPFLGNTPNGMTVGIMFQLLCMDKMVSYTISSKPSHIITKGDVSCEGKSTLALRADLRAVCGDRSPGVRFGHGRLCR